MIKECIECEKMNRLNGEEGCEKCDCRGCEFNYKSEGIYGGLPEYFSGCTERVCDVVSIY